MKNLQSIVKKSTDILDRLEIPYSKDVKFTVNNRAKKRLGQCKYRYNQSEGKYVAHEIQISSCLMDDDVKEELTINTMIHELIHSTLPEEGHKGKWKEYADLVTEKTGIKIERCGTKEEAEMLNNKFPAKYKYKVVCQGCGKTYLFERKRKFVSYAGYYKCVDCGYRFKAFYSEKGWK